MLQQLNKVMIHIYRAKAYVKVRLKIAYTTLETEWEVLKCGFGIENRLKARCCTLSLR